MTKRILVAGIGNIFLGDDAFGVETARALTQRGQPDGVTVTDFGIRSHDLAFALAEDYEAVVLIDAAPRGYAPGTVYLIEPEIPDPTEVERNFPNGHDMDVVRALQMARRFGGQPGRLYLVGCEPAVLESDGGQMGLSAAVRDAVPRAVRMVQALLNEVLSGHKQDSGLVPA